MTDSGRPRSSRLALIVVGVAGLLVVGYILGRVASPAPADRAPPAMAASPAAPVTWTCSMHPQVHLPRPGPCPLCGMDLIPLEAPGSNDGPRRLVMSNEDRKLAQVATAPVRRQAVTAEVRMVGKVNFDETRMRTISSWVAGRVDRLFLDSEGVVVKQGEHLALVYSPQLLTAQQELVEARRWVDAAVPEPSEFLRAASLRTLESAREKLRLLGLQAEQLANIEESGSVEEHVVITSPSSGIVVSKHVRQGDYVGTGMRMFEIADLSHLWVELDAYESDLQWLRYGQEAGITAEALPGSTFQGLIAFIDPLLESRTRTVKVRVNVPNPEGLLKPGMFVRATVSSHLAVGGRVVEPRLAGKWLCPMHPEVVRDRSGACPVCGMPLVRAKALGYTVAEEGSLMPLVVPATAVLQTGRRAVVYVEVPGATTPTYEGREVVLGPRAGDDYVVLEGLADGENVVVNGNFKIDSALQILAKPSMMSPEGGAPARVHQHGGGAQPPAAHEGH